MRGNITRRGAHSWRLKADLPRGPDGKRQVRVLTIHGTKRDAQRELTRLVHSIDAGTYVDPSELTVAEWLIQWLAGLRLTPRNRESWTMAPSAGSSKPSAQSLYNVCARHTSTQ